LQQGSLVLTAQREWEFNQEFQEQNITDRKLVTYGFAYFLAVGRRDGFLLQSSSDNIRRYLSDCRGLVDRE